VLVEPGMQKPNEKSKLFTSYASADMQIEKEKEEESGEVGGRRSG